MKDGSFEVQMTGLDFTPDQDLSNDKMAIEELRSTATINEVPKKYDMRSLPEEFRKSDVIDTLISQNEELMGRLTVALRRAALLDEKVTDAKTEAARFRSRYTNANDQILVLKEQSRVLTERIERDKTHTTRIDRTKQDLAEKLQVAEIRYAELHSTNQDKVKKYENIIELYQSRLRRFDKYRNKIKNIVANLRTEKENYATRIEKSEITQSDLKRSLEESTKHIAEQAKASRDHAQELTDAYEMQLKEKNAEIEMLMIQNQTLGERAKEVDRLLNEKVRIENELIVSERRRTDMKSEMSTEVHELQKQVSQFRNESKTLAVELNSKLEELNSTSHKLENVENERKDLQDQVETLQMLWREQQAQVEKLSNQKDSLQKLNKELSVAVNEYRREIRELKETNEATEAMVQMSRANPDDHPGTAAGPKQKAKGSEDVSDIAKSEKGSPDIISKIDKALSQLHIGR